MLFGKDPYKGPAQSQLRSAIQCREKVGKALGAEPKNPNDARKKALSTERDLVRARDYATNAVTLAQDYVNNAYGRREKAEADELLKRAQEVAQSCQDSYTVLEALKDPRNRSKQKSLADLLKEKVTDKVIDDITSSLLTSLWQYATYHTIDGVIAIFGNLPPGSGFMLRWAGGAVSELADHLRGKWQTANSGRDPQAGGCLPNGPQCHGCQTGRGCQYRRGWA